MSIEKISDNEVKETTSRERIQNKEDLEIMRDKAQSIVKSCEDKLKLLE